MAFGAVVRSYGCAFASSEQLPGLPPARMHTRYSHGST
jgi:hypothetical protein